MPLITWDLDNNLLDLSGLDTAFQDKLELPAPSEQTIRIGFYRQTSGDARQYLDLGADPSIEFLIKPATGNGRFDASPVVASPTFTRTTVDDLGNYFYEGSLNLAAPVFLKALGINSGINKEVINIECSACVAGSLGGRYMDIHAMPSGNPVVYRCYYTTPAINVQPDATGVTLVEIPLSDEDLTADEVATETQSGMYSDPNIYGAGTSVGFNTISVTDNAVLMTASTFSRLGAHDPKTTGFTITVVTAGGYPSGDTDVTSASYNGQLVYLDGTAPQLSPLFTMQLNNSLYRDGQTFPPGVASSNYRTGSVVLSTTDSATVTFSSAMPTSDYKIIESVVRYTGAGSPGLKLCACSIEDRATTGFTVYFNGNATTDYTFDYTVTA